MFTVPVINFVVKILYLLIFSAQLSLELHYPIWFGGGGH